MAVILPAGNTKANSPPFTLSAGQAVTLTLFPGSQGNLKDAQRVGVEYQSNGVWVSFGTLLAYPAEERVKVIQAPGTFRVSRPAQQYDVGVDKTP